jgi:hypothetical protein
MFEHQNYHEDCFMSMISAGCSHSNGFGINYSSYLNNVLSFTLKKIAPPTLIFIVYCFPIRFPHKQVTNSIFPISENCKLMYL